MRRYLQIAIAISVLLAACFSSETVLADTPAKNASAIGTAKLAEDPHLGERVENICFQRPILNFNETREDAVVIMRGQGDSIFVSESLTSLSDEGFTTCRCRINKIYKWGRTAQPLTDSAENNSSESS